MKILLLAKDGGALTGPGTYKGILFRELSRKHKVTLADACASFPEPDGEWDIAHILDIKHSNPALISRLKCPLIVDVHDYYWTRFYPFLSLDFPLRLIFQVFRRMRYKKVIKQSDAVITHCEYVRERIDHPFKYLLWIGIDVSSMGPGDTKKEDMVLFVGRDYFRKGILTLIKAAHIVRKDFSGVKFVVVGKEWRHSELFSRFLARNLPFEFRGATPNDQVIELYRKAKVFVLPSHIEASPITVSEAMATGTPVVASRVGGIPEMVRDGYDGLLFQRGNAEQLGNKICAALRRDNDIEDIVLRGYKTVRERFNADVMIPALEDIYKSVILRYKRGKDIQ